MNVKDNRAYFTIADEQGLWRMGVARPVCGRVQCMTDIPLMRYLDLVDAVNCMPGVRVSRVGTVGDAQGLSYMVLVLVRGFDFARLMEELPEVVGRYLPPMTPEATREAEREAEREAAQAAQERNQSLNAQGDGTGK